MALHIQNFKIQPSWSNFWVTKNFIIINLTYDIRVSRRNNHQNMVNTSFWDDWRWKIGGLDFQVQPSLSEILLKNAKNFDLKIILKSTKNYKNFFCTKKSLFFQKLHFYKSLAITSPYPTLILALRLIYENTLISIIRDH